MGDNEAVVRSAEASGPPVEGGSLFVALAAGLAHELNNLLTVMRGSVEPLRREITEPRNAKRLEHLALAVDRAARVTQSLNAFARVQRPETRFDLNAELRSVAPHLRRVLGDAGTLALELGVLPVPVQADPAALRAALTQIVLNCREAMAERGRTVLRSSTRHDASGRPVEVALSIEDTGCGMTPEVAARAAELFFTTKPPGCGVGLGLAMACGFMKQSGGRLEVESREGEGTTVRLVFPIADAPQTVLPRGRRGETILIVEEDADIRLQAASMLRSLGYQVEAAATADTALAWLADGARADLLLTDRLAAVDPARTIVRGLKVLYCSGLAGRQEDSVLAKPFNLIALGRAVRTALDAEVAAAGSG